MAEIRVENIENPEPAASEPAASAEVPPAQPVLERQVAFQTTSGEVSFEAAPKKRGGAGPKKAAARAADAAAASAAAVEAAAAGAGAVAPTGVNLFLLQSG